MHVNGCEPVISNEIPRGFTVRDMSVLDWIDVAFGEAEVYHIHGFLVWRQSDCAVSKLNICSLMSDHVCYRKRLRLTAMKDTTRVHEFHSGYLRKYVQVKYAADVNMILLTTCIPMQQTLRRSIMAFPLFR